MNNTPEDAKVLLDTLACAGHVATGLSVIKDRCDDGITDLRSDDVSNLGLYVDTLHRIEQVGRAKVQHICPGGSNVIKGYDKVVVANRKKEEEDTRSSAPYFMRKLREFRDACKKGLGKKKSQKPPPPLPPTNKATRSSERQQKIVSPEKTTEDLLMKYNGQPRYPDKRWSRTTLCKALKELNEINNKRKDNNERVLISPRKFMERVAGTGLSPYKDRSGIHRMYTNWLKSENAIVPEGRGRPSTIDLDDLEEMVKDKMQDRTSDSSRFKVEHMEEVFKEKKMKEAEQNGLESERVNCSVTDETLKAAMMAVAMKGAASGLGMSTKKLATKTEKRFQAEHSVMGAYAYATTVLSTHFVEGPRPYSLRKYQPMKLSDDAKQTVEWVREAFGADEVHPVDPNLVLSTDDTTLFVFEGATNDGCVDKWEWKLYDKTEPASSVHSDFQVGDDVQMAGGLRVRLTFTFTASGLAAPPYVAVSGLTEEELSPVLCEHGILAEKIPGLCKGGNDLFNEGFGWLVFLRADRKNNKKDQEEAALSIANKKFIHYNDEVLLPFIRSIREKLGWKKGQQIPDYLKACSWFDGDIGQLQTMIDEAREALDEAEKIIRNKHSAASTGRQQPADLTPVFRLIKAFQLNATAKDDVACGLSQTIDEYFSTLLRTGGLNLDGNPRKKKALIDFLLCLPEMMERSMLKKHIKRGFVEAGMIDEETGHVPTFEKLMSTCIRWGSADKNVGIQRSAKNDCRAKFQELMKIQMENGQISYTDMATHGIPGDIDSKCQELDYVRPSGADAEHRQPAKTINAKWQKKLREEKRKRKLTEKHVKAAADHDVINIILQRNREVEEELLGMRNEIGSLADVTVGDLLQLKKPHSERLKAFIHARKFNGREFKQSQLTGANGKLNLMLRKNQSAESIEADCNEDSPCLFWYAWKLRSDEIVLSARDVPVLDIPMVLPQFTVTSARPTNKKRPSEYLSDPIWLGALSSAVKGAEMIPVSEELMKKADYLCSSLEARLCLHIASSRVDRSKQNHWSLRLFTRENLPAMAAAICIFGHIVDDDITTYGVEDCLLCMPMSRSEGFCLIDGNEYVGSLQGCYLYFDWTKFRWIRSGKTSGDGTKACFRGRGDTHKKNAKSVDEMKAHQFYQLYPAKGVQTIGVRKGYFDDLSMYCGMAFDPSESDGVSNLCSNGEIGSLFVWSKEVMRELNEKGGELQKVQLDAIAYLWELCYDLLLAESHNVSVSPGFESLGLRVNRTKKRKACD